MLKNLSFNKCDIYIFIWGLYSLQGFLYPRGQINFLLQLILIVWGISTIVPWGISNNRIIKSCYLLLLMYIIYGGSYLIEPLGYRDYNGVLFSRYQYLQSSLNSLLPIITFYVYTLRGYLDQKRVVVYSIYFLIIYIFVYYQKQQELIIAFSSERIDRVEFTNNTSYNFLALIPLVFFMYKRPLLQYFYLSVVIYFIIMGMKRGAILLMALSLLFFIFENYRLNNSKFNRWLIIIITLFLGIGIYYSVSYMMDNSYYFMHRWELTMAGDSSGRDSIYSATWNGIINESSLLLMLFGRGAYSTVIFSGHLAHHDWLEVLCNNGFVGGIILATFFVSILVMAYSSKNILPRYMYNSFILVFYIAFLKTFFSMSIQDMELCQSLLIGYLAANYEVLIDDEYEYFDSFTQLP